MLVKVIGERELDFTTADGKQIKGKKVFVCYKSNNDFDKGEVADGVFISSTHPLYNTELQIGKDYQFIYTCAGLGGRSSLTSIKDKDGKDLPAGMPF